MTRVLQLPIVAVLCLLFTANTPFAQEPKLPGLLKLSPSPANTVAYINIPALSQLMADAKMEGKLAAGVNEIWAVSELNTSNLTPKWEAGYATLKTAVDPKALATALGGYVDKVAGKETIWTPSQSYLTPIEGNRLGFIRPADRTLLAKWLQKNGNLPISDFLKKQATRGETYLSFLLAVDLQNTFSPVALENRLETFDSLGSSDPKKVARILSKVNGISIIVGRKSLGQCILTVEFSESPAELLPIANAILNEVLNRNGTGAPEVANWKAKVDGNSLAFQGAISENSLDGVLGILSIRGQADKVAASAGGPEKEVAGSNLLAYKSKQYFDDVNKLIDRVRRYEAQSTGYRAKWNDQQARRIEEIGTLNVDEDLVNYGADVATMLRGNATAIRTGNVAAGQIQASGSGSGYGGGYYSGGYGGGYYGYNYGGQNAYSHARDQASVGARQRMGAFGSFKEALAAIDQRTADMRRSMTAKYKIQF